MKAEPTARTLLTSWLVAAIVTWLPAPPHGMAATPGPAVAPAATAARAQARSRLLASNARVRALLPGQDKTVGYVDLRNTGSEPVTLVRAESDQIRAIEFHTTIRDGEVMRMRRLADVVIEPGATRRFEPGGHHLMLFGVRSLPETIEIRLLTADGAVLTVNFERVSVMAHQPER